MRGLGTGEGALFVSAGFVLVAIVSAVGCGRASGDDPRASSNNASEEAPHVSAENAVVYSLAKHHLAAVRLALSQGRDPTMSCKSLMPLVDSLETETDPTVVRLVGASTRTCGYEAPLAWAEANLAALEGGASAAAPCVHVEGALDELRRFGHGESPRVREVDAAYRRACDGSRG